MTSTFCLFELVNLNDLLFDKWVDHVANEVLKSPIFVVKKACQGSNGTIGSSLGTAHDVAQRCFVVFAFNLSRLCSL